MTRSSVQVAYLVRAMGLAVPVAVCATTPSCVLARPARASIGPPPAALAATPVAFPSGSGVVVHAWLMPGRTGGGAVLLLHGVGANRLAMLGRARFLRAAGYTVLAPDFQAHGETAGEHVTFGARESLDAAAAVAFLRATAPGERVGVIGVSMGGAAALLGPTPLPVDALVLESVYPTFRDAVADRFGVWFGPFGFIGRGLAPVLIALVGPSIGVSAESLRPITRIGEVSAPVFLISGSSDSYTRPNETRALFARVRAASKQFWEVPGAGHVDLHGFAPADYERRVGAFLDEALRSANREPTGAITSARTP